MTKKDVEITQSIIIKFSRFFQQYHQRIEMLLANSKRKLLIDEKTEWFIKLMFMKVLSLSLICWSSSMIKTIKNQFRNVDNYDMKSEDKMKESKRIEQLLNGDIA
jgi:hypothetical protein